MPSLEVALEDCIRPIALLGVLTLFCLIFLSFSFDVRADLWSNSTETTSSSTVGLAAKLAGPVSLVQIGNNLFVVTPLRVILAIIVILVISFVIAIRKRWIEISFESESEGGLLLEEETEGEADERLSIPGETSATNRRLPSERPTGLAESELPRIAGEIIRARVALETERSKFERSSRDLAVENQALRKLRKELSAETQRLIAERRRLENLREHLSRDVAQLSKAKRPVE
jgi:hypothetical protein